VIKRCKDYGWTEQNINFTEPLAGHICHHINNPLMILKGIGLKLSKEGHPKSDTLLEQVERIEKYIQWIKENSDGNTRLLRERSE